MAHQLELDRARRDVVAARRLAHAPQRSGKLHSPDDLMLLVRGVDRLLILATVGLAATLASIALGA